MLKLYFQVSHKLLNTLISYAQSQPRESLPLSQLPFNFVQGTKYFQENILVEIGQFRLNVHG